jgi:hypothetical protein
MAKQCAICEKKGIMSWRLKKLRGKYNPTIKTRKQPNLQWVRLIDSGKILLSLVTVSLYFLIINYPVSAISIPIRSFFTLNAVDSETGEFVGGPIKIQIVEELQGTILDMYNLTVFQPGDIKYVPWNPGFRDSGLKVHLTALKDGYFESEPYIFTVDETTPNEGLLFDYTFIMQLESPVKAKVIHEETHNVELQGRQFDIELITSSEVLDFGFKESSKSLSISINETTIDGLLDVSIPNTFMEGPFTITIDNVLIISFLETTRDDSVLLSLTYTTGMHDITIKSWNIVNPKILPPKTSNPFEFIIIAGVLVVFGIGVWYALRFRGKKK